MCIFKIERKLAEWIHILYCAKVKSSEFNYKFSLEFQKDLAAVHRGLNQCIWKTYALLPDFRTIFDKTLLHTVQGSNLTLQWLTSAVVWITILFPGQPEAKQTKCFLGCFLGWDFAYSFIVCPFFFFYFISPNPHCTQLYILVACPSSCGMWNAASTWPDEWCHVRT